MYTQFLQIFYTAIIWGVTIGAPIFLYLIIAGLAKIKSKRLKIILITIWSLFWVTIVYGSFIEPKIIVINNTSADIEKINAPIKIALVSDLHYSPWKKQDFAKKTINKLIELKPDLILIAGDLIAGEEEELAYLKPWREITNKIPIFAVLGNHEFNAHRADWPTPNLELAKKAREKIKQVGINLLENESKEINIGKTSLYLVGLGDIWAGDLRLEEASKDLNSALPIIALAHNPDVLPKIIEADFKPNLFLAGHTHSGQVRLPFFGPLGIIPTKLGQKFDEGWFDFNGIKMFITSGLGETSSRIRFWNPPEIVLITIK